MVIKVIDSEALCGYTQKTTFYSDFSIADHFGKAAILDTYHRAFKDWKDNVEYITELCMVLNWKCWEHAESGADELAELYVNLYYEVSDWCFENLKGDDLSYFIRTTD